MLRALASPLPIAWVTADAAYGQEWRFRRMLEEAAVGYVLAVPKYQRVPRLVRIDYLFGQAPDEACEQRSCGDGAKDARAYDWAVVQLPVIDDFDGDRPTITAGALARRSISRPDQIAYYLAYAPMGTGGDQLMRVAGLRQAIEECLRDSKNECGLDRYEVRRLPAASPGPRPPLRIHVLRWSRWQRRHQAVARHCHCRRRCHSLEGRSGRTVPTMPTAN
ncbi:hypothetical protein ACIPJS_39600 [Streptomyces sp. NPDC086783]|uniref:hypothetical protein n=1 Tax=Streptomyces sp. NPDC086783 TaxID=3365758 RepID=UPI00382C1E1A